MSYLAVGILVAVVGAALLQPTVAGFRLRPHWAALCGALAMLASGLVSPTEAAHSLQFMGAPLLTLASLMVMTLIADKAGLFVAFTRAMARAAGGNAKLLFTYLFFGGTVVGALFTNDAAVLILTPLVAGLVLEISTDTWGPRATLPYFFAVLYVANLVGLLVISNPINIVVAEKFGISFVEYARWMVAPALASIVCTYFGLRFYFRHDLPETFKLTHRAQTQTAPSGFLRLCALVIGLTLVGFFTQGITGFPLHGIASAGAIFLAGAYKLRENGALRPVIRHLAWDVLLFVSTIFIVALGIRNSGLTADMGHGLRNVHYHSLSLGLVTTSSIAAGLSALMNNHPIAYTMSLAIDDMELGAAAKPHVFAALIGGDLGPKMLPMGSVAALLWFRILHDRGVHISYWEYIKLGVPVTLLALLAALAVLRLEIAIF